MLGACGAGRQGPRSPSAGPKGHPALLPSATRAVQRGRRRRSAATSARRTCRRPVWAVRRGEGPRRSRGRPRAPGRKAQPPPSGRNLLPGSGGAGHPCRSPPTRGCDVRASCHKVLVLPVAVTVRRREGSAGVASPVAAGEAAALGATDVLARLASGTGGLPRMRRRGGCGWRASRRAILPTPSPGRRPVHGHDREPARAVRVLGAYFSAHRTMINGSALGAALAVTERD